MRYDWKCRNCGLVVEVERPVSEHSKRPTEAEIPDTDACIHGWDRYFSTSNSPSVPFQTLRDKGIFMDEHGNYPPRKMPWQ